MPLWHGLLRLWATTGQTKLQSYKRSNCRKVVSLGRRGRSETEFALALGVTQQTLRQWARAYPEFGAALEFASDCALSYWEDLGRRQLLKIAPRQDPSLNKRTRRKHRRRHRLNGQLYVKELARRFPREYGPQSKVPRS